MAWQDTIVPIVRGLVFDLTSPYVYSCTRLEELVVVSAVLVIQELTFPISYTINLEAITITPDPTDEDFIALVALRTACLISHGEHRDAAKKAISFKDGPAFVDTKERAKYLGDLAEGACTAYARAKVNYQMGDGTLGRAIVGPYAAGQSSETGRRFG